MNCSQCQDLIAAYALDALTGDERQQVRAHLESGCPRCSADLAGFQAVIEKFPLMLDPIAPPPAVKERLMDRVQADGVAPERRATSPRSGAGGRWAGALVTGLAAAAAVAAVFWVKVDRQQGRIAELQDELDRQHARIDQMQASLEQDGSTLRLFASPAVQLVSLQGGAGESAAKGRAFWDRDRGAFHLYASGLKPLPAGKVYELWFINAEQKKIPGGTFAAGGHGEGSLVATLPADAGRIAAVAVTDEPAGGSPQPTGQIHLIGKPG